VELPKSYMNSVLGPRDEVVNSVLEKALLQNKLRPMQVDDNAARILKLLTLMIKPKQVLEIGTYFGYSALHIASGLSKDGKLISIEIDEEIAQVAIRNIELAGLSNFVDVVCGDATKCLAQYSLESFDMIFIDGEKAKYPEYLKVCYPLLRKDGILIADDSFASGDYRHESVENSIDTSDDHSQAIDTYNRAVGRSKALFSTFIGTSNGMLVSYKL